MISVLRSVTPRPLLHSRFLYRNVLRFLSTELTFSTVDWKTTDKFQQDKAVLLKKLPDRKTSELNLNPMEQNLIASKSIPISDFFSYSAKITNQYKALLATGENAKIMNHFETELIVLNFYIFKLYIQAASNLREYDKAVEMYEKYSNLFTNQFIPQIILCYIKIKNAKQALQLVKTNLDSIQEVNLAKLFEKTTVPQSILTYLLAEPKLEKKLPLQSLQNALESGKYKLFETSLRQKIEKIRTTLGGSAMQSKNVVSSTIVYTEVFQSLRAKLGEYKKNPSSFDASVLLQMIKTLFFEKKTFFQYFPSYLYLAQQQLLPEQFFEFLVESLLFLVHNNEYKEVFEISSRYTFPPPFQERFFKKYISHCEALGTFVEMKEAMERITPWVKKNAILNQFLQGKYTTMRDVLIKYYLIFEEYENAEAILAASLQTIDSKPFTAVLTYLYDHKLNEQYIFLFQHVTLKLLSNTSVKIHDMYLYRYVTALNVLKRLEEVISFYKYTQLLNRELSLITLFQLMLCSSQCDIDIFGQVFDEFISRANASEFKINGKELSYIIFNLENFGQQNWIQQIEKRVLSRFKLNSPLLPTAQNILYNH